MRKILHLWSLLLLLGLLPLSAQVTLQLPTTTATCGTLLQLPVTVENFDSLTAVQFSIQWDPELLVYAPNGTNEVLIAGETVRLNPQFIEEGILVFTWASATPLSLTNGETLLIFSLQAKAATANTTALTFSSEKTAISVLGNNGIVMPNLVDGVVNFTGGIAPPIALNCQDTIFQYTSDLSCEVAAEWPIPEFETCNGDLMIDATHSLGTIFEVGSQEIVYTATDELGTIGTCNFILMVRDTIAPRISNCPDNMEINFSRDDGCDLSVDWQAPSFLERCSSTETEVTSNFRSGDNFPVGTSVVTYMATDVSGNTSTCSFEVIVTGSDPITFERQPENVQLTTLPGECGNTYEWEGPPMAISGCAPVNLITNFEPGSFFPVGTTVVEYVATDQINQRAVWAFSVTVVDDQPMAARCPSDIELDANGQVLRDSMNFVKTVQVDACGTYQLVFNEIEVLDNCTSSISTSLQRGNSSEFNFGTTQMEYLVSNNSGESVTCNFQISIKEAPTVAVNRSTELACVDTELQLLATADLANFYDIWNWTGPNGFTSQEQNPIIAVLTSEMAGTYIVVASSSTASCTATASMDIAVFGEAGIPVIDIGKSIVCEGEAVTMSTPGSNGATYEWIGPNDLSTSDLTITIDNALPEQTGNYELTRTVEGCTSAPASIRLIVLSELTLVDDVVNTFINNTIEFEVISNDTFERDAPFSISTFPDPVNGTIMSNRDGSFSYTPMEDFVGNDQFSYEICYEACPEYCASSILTVRTAISDEQCTYPTFLSPNNDDQNELLVFPCNTGDIADSGIIIFNQWGAVVYEAFPYNNDWGGTYNGEPLPDGTYYYVYRASADDPAPIKNCVTIFR